MICVLDCPRQTAAGVLLATGSRVMVLKVASMSDQFQDIGKLDMYQVCGGDCFVDEHYYENTVEDTTANDDHALLSLIVPDTERMVESALEHKWDLVRNYLNDRKRSNSAKCCAIWYRDRSTGDSITTFSTMIIHDSPSDIIELMLNIVAEDKDKLLNSCSKKTGMTPLHLACERGNLDTVRLIVSSCTDMNTILQRTENKHGWLPIHFACQGNQNLKIIKFLVEHSGPDMLNHADNNGQLPLHIAAKGAQFNVETSKFLVGVGGKDTLYVPDRHKQMPIHHLCQSSSPFIGKILSHFVSEGDDDMMNSKDENHVLPCMYLLANNNATVADIKVALGLMQPHMLVPKGNIEVEQLFDAIRKSSVQKVTLLLDTCDVLDDKILSLKDTRNMNVMQNLCKGRASGSKQAFDVILLLQDRYCQALVLEKDTIEAVLDWTQNLQSEFQHELFKHGRYLKSILNKLFIERRNVFIVMLDLYVQIIIVIFFSFEDKFETYRGYDTFYIRYIVFCLSILWVLVREISQIINIYLTYYIHSIENWTDLLQLGFFAWVILAFGNGNKIDFSDGFERLVFVFFTGIAWVKLLFNIGHLIYPIAVFMEAFFKVRTLIFLINFSKSQICSFIPSDCRSFDSISDHNICNSCIICPHGS